jgi:RNA polymerase sigma factor for flagellar operon FliA
VSTRLRSEADDYDDSLVERWRAYTATGDPEARGRLALHYAPLVKFVVGRIRARLPASVDQVELTNDGVIGLLDAISKFDVERGLQFQTYAVPRIRGAILDGLRASDWVPRLVREKIRDVSAAQATLEQRLGRAPTDREVATALAITVGELGAIYSENSYTQVMSMDAAEWADDIPGPRAHSEDSEDAMPVGFAAAIQGLPERDQIIVSLYYWERLSLGEISQVLGVSESRVSQLHGRATMRLRGKFSVPSS